MPAGAPSYRYLDPGAVAKLGHLDLVARAVVEGFIAGLHRSLHHGFSVEFAQHREYSRGDDPRRLDWRVWAKTDRFYIRQYDEETNMRVHLLLDSSASMGFRSASSPLSKFEYGCFLAAALAYLTLGQKDPTALALFDGQIHHWLPPKLSAIHLRRILVALENSQPTGVTNLGAGFQAVARRLRRRGLVVLLSDLLGAPEEVVRATGYFRRKKHEVIMFHVLDPGELNFPYKAEYTFTDIETSRRISGAGRALRAGYRRELEALITTYRRHCAAQGIDYCLMDTATPFDLALGNYLVKRSRLS